jgi:hypothetical protein
MFNELIKDKVFLFLVFVAVFLIVFIIAGPIILSNHYYGKFTKFNNTKKVELPKEKIFTPSYVETPDAVKGIYMTSWIASDPKLRNPLVKLIDTTELNSVVIDIKDYSGKVFFASEDPKLNSYGSIEPRVSDMRDFIEELHKKNIYVIGRVAVFQDAYMVKKRPDMAVKNKAGTEVWKDRKGISWIDASNKEYWDYIILVSKDAHAIGFDEINFDYIRFPSDGNMIDISFPWSSSTPKAIVMRNFFEYLHDNLKDSGMKISADLFGMTTTSEDDMGIGQVLENALPYFDYISPMVYPSHYSNVFENLKNPEGHPYETVNISMKRAVERAKIASSSPNKFRPWLQDFSLKVNYGAKEVREQIKATYDSGLNSWLLWSASNRYTSSALDK